MQALAQQNAVLTFKQAFALPVWEWAPTKTPASGDTAERLRFDADHDAAIKQAELIIRMQEERIRSLEALCVTDELTGLTNRRGFNLAFERELAIARRDSNEGGVLLMIDVDGFKEINDSRGHDVGDAHLRLLAQALKASIRSSDIVARIGGDEFAILLTRTRAETGIQRACELQNALGRRALPNVSLKASVGYAAYDGSASAETIVKAADRSMYARKADLKQFSDAAE